MATAALSIGAWRRLNVWWPTQCRWQVHEGGTSRYTGQRNSLCAQAEVNNKHNPSCINVSQSVRVSCKTDAEKVPPYIARVPKEHNYSLQIFRCMYVRMKCISCIKSNRWQMYCKGYAWSVHRVCPLTEATSRISLVVCLEEKRSTVMMLFRTGRR